MCFKDVATCDNVTDLQDYTEAFTEYISKCTDDVTVVITIKVPATQKPWWTGEVYSLLKTQNVAFRAGDSAEYKVVRNNLSQASGRQRSCMDRAYMATSMTTRTHGACGSVSKQ